MKKLLLMIAFILPALAMARDAQNDSMLYKEKWRPQYHYSPAHRWIGDPCGLVYFDGIFHAYCWGAAESNDLIHWTEVNREAIKGLPPKTSPFTGSVVVDRNNTAGYGSDAFIAAFTSYDQDSKKQSQSIAFSHDKGRTFQYYDLNPVIDTWSTEFRDPTVIWDEKTQRWVMLVAKALERKVAFYGSSDLKHWEWLSDFGPAGDSEKSWECPDMFLLPVEGTSEKKWVLLVSINWAREQYFVGDFDGTKFIPDNAEQHPLYVDAGLDYYASRTFQDFDGTLDSVYSMGWVSTWDYAQLVPTTYGKGVWSLPRALTLKNTPAGLRLVQKPLESLALLRGKPYVINRNLKAGVTKMDAVSAMGNQYEIVANFSTATNNKFGFNLCSSAERHLTITYDAKTGTLIMDRTNASDTEIPKFERIAFAKVAPIDGMINLNIYVDKSVVEVYAQGGECVMTALVFPSENDTAAEVFADCSGTNANITVYPLDTVHDVASK